MGETSTQDRGIFDCRIKIERIGAVSPDTATANFTWTAHSDEELSSSKTTALTQTLQSPLSPPPNPRPPPSSSSSAQPPPPGLSRAVSSASPVAGAASIIGRQNIVSIASVLWDPRYTSQEKPRFAPPSTSESRVVPAGAGEPIDLFDGVEEAKSDEEEEQDVIDESDSDDEEDGEERDSESFEEDVEVESHDESRSQKSEGRKLGSSSLATETEAKMDNKRHPSSFQQLEKLGEGTYATVRLLPLGRTKTHAKR